MDEEQEKRALALQVLNSAPPAALLREPVDYIFADHFRQRTLCRVLDEIADETGWDLEKVEAANRFLGEDFALHIADEEEDLFPLLQRRTGPEEEIGDFIDQLCEDHERNGADADRIRGSLTMVLEQGGADLPAQDFRDLLRRFSADEKRHLIFENAIILPFARARLTADDLKNFGKRMAARRGLDYPAPEKTC